MAQEKQAKLGGDLTCYQLEEKVPPADGPRRADGELQRLVLHVEQPAAVQRAGCDRSCIPVVDELREKVVGLLAGESLRWRLIVTPRN